MADKDVLALAEAMADAIEKMLPVARTALTMWEGDRACTAADLARFKQDALLFDRAQDAVQRFRSRCSGNGMTA